MYGRFGRTLSRHFTHALGCSGAWALRGRCAASLCGSWGSRSRSRCLLASALALGCAARGGSMQTVLSSHRREAFVVIGAACAFARMPLATRESKRGVRLGGRLDWIRTCERALVPLRRRGRASTLSRHAPSAASAAGGCRRGAATPSRITCLRATGSRCDAPLDGCRRPRFGEDDAPPSSTSVPLAPLHPRLGAVGAHARGHDTPFAPSHRPRASERRRSGSPGTRCTHCG